MERVIGVATAKAEMRMTSRSAQHRLWPTVAFIAALCLEGCGTVTNVGIDLAPQPCIGGYCGAVFNQPVKIRVRGKDACKLVRLNFGDGEVLEGRDIDFGATGANEWVVDHVYGGWAGAKTIKAEGVTNCTGSATQFIRVLRASAPPVTFRTDHTVGFVPSSSTCSSIPNFPPLRSNTAVKINTNPDPNIKINFCALNGCVHDADGIPNSSASANYPFPGLKELSLVLRIGTQVVQGGTDMSFTTNKSGPLEICVNDTNLTDNGGAWGIHISVDESLAL